MESLFDDLEVPAAADFHVHLRDGPMMQAVTRTIRQAGVDTVFVMVVCTHTSFWLSQLGHADSMTL